METKKDFNKTKEGILTRLKRIPEVKALYLFGSYAGGKEKPMSDIDICAITERGITESRRLEILSYGGGKIDISLFWDIPVSIRSKVLREGMMLFCRDKLFMDEVLAGTMKEYLDFNHVLERFTRLYIGG